MGLSTPDLQVISGRAWRGLGAAALALVLSAACGGGGGGANTDGPAATSLTASTTSPLRGAAFHLTPVYSNGTGAITYPGGTVACPATGQASSDITANWSGAREYTLTVTSSANATDTRRTTVTPQTVSVGAISPAAPAIQPSGGPTSFSASVSGGATGNVTWSVAVGTNANAGTIDASSGDYTAPATTGTVIVTATSVDDSTKSNSTTVTIATARNGNLAASTTTPLYGATNVTIIPTFADAASVLVGISQGGSDLAVNPTSGQAITVQADGFTAAWTYWMQMTDLFSNQSDYSVTITPQTVSLTAVSPATPTIVGGASLSFSGATVSGGYLGTRTWSVAAGTNASAGIINASTGVYTAPTTGGTVIITATSNDDETKSVNTTATVVAGPAITSFTISQGTFTSGATGATAHATFTGGTGLITGGGIAAPGLSITGDGTAVPISPAPTATTTYTLTVHSTQAGTTDDTRTAKALVGTMKTLAGVPSGMGSINGSIASVAGTKARFWMPNGLALDPNANLYVADYENNCIRKIDTSGQVTTPYGNTGDLQGSSDGNGNDASFWGPAGMVADSNYLYVIDAWNQTIRKINTSTNDVITLAGTAGTFGYVNAPGVSTNTSGVSQFHFCWNGSDGPSMIPPSLVLSGSTLYVADQLNHCIRAVDTTTGAVTDAYGSPGTSGTGDTASGTVTFNTPTGLVLNGTTLFVADYGSNRIRAINTGTSTVTTLVNSGLSGPVSLAVIGANLYEVDYAGCVVNTVPTAGGTLSVLAGTQGSSGNADGDGTAASFNSPTAVVNMGTDLFITDLANNTVRRVNTLSTHTVSTYAGVISDPAYSDSGSGKFNGPTGVVYDNGIVYVADTSNGAVRSINLTTGTVATVLYKGVNPAPANMSPSAIAVDSNHTLYIADDYANAIYTYNGTTLSTVTAAGASFDKPSGMVVDSQGNLYVADANAAKVYKIAGGVATELGALSYHYPCGLALSTDESVLYVADGSGRVIFEQPLTGSVAPTILAGGNGTWTLGYLDGTGAAALFGSVAGMARDAAGNLYVADTSNNVIRQVTPTGIVTTICGTYGSMANVASGSSFALPSTLANPQAVALVPTLGEGDNMMFIAIGDAIQAISFH